MTRWWTGSRVKGSTSGYTQTSSSLLSTQVPDLMPAFQTVKQPHCLLLEMLLHWLFFVQIAQCVSTSLSSHLYILVLLGKKKNISVSCFAWSRHSVVYLLWPFLFFILFFYVLCQVGCSSLTWKGPWMGLWSGGSIDALQLLRQCCYHRQWFAAKRCFASSKLREPFLD